MSAHWSTRHRMATGLMLALLGSTFAAAVPANAVPSGVTAAVSTVTTSNRPAVVSHRVIGHSVNGHPIRAYQLGNPKATVTVVALAAMHGNEQGGIAVLGDLRDGRPISGVNLWVIPRANPDGVLRDDRHNA